MVIPKPAALPRPAAVSRAEVPIPAGPLPALAIPSAPIPVAAIVAPLQPRARTTLWIGAAGLALFTGVAFAAVAWRSTPSEASLPPLPPPPAPKSAAAPIAITATATAVIAPEPAVVAAAKASADPVGAAKPASTTGRVVLPAAAAGHRVFMDDRVVSDGKSDVVVSCGPHKLRIGSGGKTLAVDVPCGGDLNLKQ